MTLLRLPRQVTLRGWLRLPSSITGRLALTFAVITTLVFVAVGLSLVAFQISELRRYQASDLKSRIQIVEAMVADVEDPRQFGTLRERLAAFTPADDGLRFIIWSDDPNYRYGRTWPADAERGPGALDAYCMHFENRVFMAFDSHVPASGNRPAVTITVAVDLAPVERTSLMLSLGILLVSALGAAVVTLIAHHIVRTGLRPLERLSTHAAQLNSADLTLRLPRHNLPRELDGLTLSFNDALTRLEEAYLRLSRFNADVAHELRTPLNNMIGQTQVALSRTRAPGELETVLQSNLEDLDRLRAIINDMLFLARADEGALAGNRSFASVAELVRKTGEFMDVLYEEAGMSLTIEGDALALVEPALFSRAMTNLLDNALRYGRPFGEVTVAITRDAGKVRIAVRNQSAPLTRHELARLFDRFYRSDPSRMGSGDSHGLGLAIVKAVALMHQGGVFADYADGRVTVGFSIAGIPLGRHSPAITIPERELEDVG